MRYAVTHTTDYTGSEPVSVGQNQSWLTPRELPFQVLENFELLIDPAPSARSELTDYFGNRSTLFSFDSGYRKLEVTAQSTVDVRPRKHPEPDQTAPWRTVAAQVRRPNSAESLTAAQFAFDSPRAAAAHPLAEYARESFRADTPILEGLIDLTQRIFREFKYRQKSTTVSTPVDEVFQKRHGVCQDFAHLQLAMLRSIGLAGRYVSGYLRTTSSSGDGDHRGADASHAWLSAYCGEAGWIDVDPTNNLVVSEDHITVAWGRDYGDVPPLRGVFIGGGSLQLDVKVKVQPLDS